VISRAERYLAHLDKLSGGISPTFAHVDSTKPALKGVTVITYANLPNDQNTTLTYGLSLAEHPDWSHVRPELCLSVRSSDDRWPEAVGLLAEGMRGECPFRYGDVIDFGEPIAPDSKCSAFVVFAPAVLDPADCRIEVSDDGADVIVLTGLYPIHAAEQQFISANGLEAFWKLDWDPFDVKRPPAV
jgi:hypothetical protein